MQQFRDYEVIEELGEGGMGVVFRAKHRLRGTEVALKVIHPHLANKQEARDRFLSEARILDRLEHPNILAVRDYVVDDDRLVIVTDLLDGRPMDTILSESGDVDIATKLDWLKQLIEGITYAHDRDIIHRDLKPSNLFVTRDNQIKILDFGLGKDLSSDARMTGTGQILGTPAYLPPETYRIENKVPIRDVGKKGDVFAVGVIAYRLLSGHLPFNMDEGLSATEVFTLLAVNYNAGKAIVPMAIRDKAISPALIDAVIDAVMNCLALDPNDRPESLQGLQATLTDKPTELDETSLPTDVKASQPNKSLTGLDTYFEVSQNFKSETSKIGPEQSARNPEQPTTAKKTLQPTSSPQALTLMVSKESASTLSQSKNKRSQGESIAMFIKGAVLLAVALVIAFYYFDIQNILKTPFQGTTDGEGEKSLFYEPSDEKPLPIAFEAKEAWSFSENAGVYFTYSEVTLGQYKKCVKAGACTNTDHLTKSDYLYCNWGYSNRDDQPMNCVKWYGAKAFCDWIGGRLPTEDEWLAAALDASSNDNGNPAALRSAIRSWYDGDFGNNLFGFHCVRLSVTSH